MKKKNKFYVVWIGREQGIYTSWAECEKQVAGYENAVYKSFSSLEHAEKAYAGNSSDYIGIKTSGFELASKEIEKYGLPVKGSICVDGAWNTSTNEIEYQGVSFPDSKRLFHGGPFDIGTNNIAEFLAIVHALSYCKQHQLASIIIYSDSRTAISWVKKKKAATKLQRNDSSKYILSVIDRAENWLKNNLYGNPILKWETVAWGENPADFGRK